MLSKKKKIVILSVMAVLLVVSGYLNIALNNSVAQVANTNTSQASFFATYRTDRVNTRNQEILYLDAIIASEANSDEAKNNAQEKKVSLIQTMELELVMEGLIKAKGFDDVIVTNTTSNVNVIVKGLNLTSSEVSQIVDVVEEQTGKSIDNINVIPVE